MPNKKAFTLVELLLVITLIGILIGALTKVLTGSLARARDTQRMADVRLIADFLTDKYIHTGIALPSAHTYYCLMPSNTTGYIGKAVKDEVDKAGYFVGRFPTDPKSKNSTPSARNCWVVSGSNRCCGQYLYYKPPATCSSGVPSKFPFLVAAQLENPDRGNLPSRTDAVNLARCGPSGARQFGSSGPIFGVVGSR